MLGENYTLSCEVMGVSVDVTSYKWTKNGTNLTMSQSLFLMDLQLSDAGLYTCEVIVDSLPYVNSTTINIKGLYKDLR